MVLRRTGYFLFAVSLLSALMAGLLAITKGSADIYILDHYFLIRPVSLLFVSTLFLLFGALAIWVRKIVS
jgi:hypothetical protein